MQTNCNASKLVVDQFFGPTVHQLFNIVPTRHAGHLLNQSSTLLTYISMNVFITYLYW